MSITQDLYDDKPHPPTTDERPPIRVAITGGTSGLGRALVRELRRRGARVAFVARSHDNVQRVAAEEPGTHGIVGDVSRKDDIHPIAIETLAALGGLDVLVNNASSLGPVPLTPLADTACEDLELALATSAREGRPAFVVNISSDAAVNAYSSWGAYGASKAALLHLTRIWHEELSAEGVHVLSFDPGDMDTPLHALAVPDADTLLLKSPETAARELLEVIGLRQESRL